MDCFYINLDAQTERRDALEANFTARKAEGWSLSRFRAVDASDVVRADVPGAASLAEKACFLSHRNLIRETIATGRPMMILEDDALFGDMSCPVIERGLATLGEAGWDLLFTDICVPSVGFWPDFVRFQRLFRRTKEIRFINLAQLQFAGATAYILNPGAKLTLLSLLEAVDSIDYGYDLYLRDFTHQSRLRSHAFVPFATSLSPLSAQSSIQTIDDGAPDPIWDLFRRMVWMEADPRQHLDAIETVRAAYSDDETRLFAPLFEAMISDRMRVK